MLHAGAYADLMALQLSSGRVDALARPSLSSRAMSWLTVAVRIAAGLLGAELSDDDEDEAEPSSANSETEEDDEGAPHFSDTDPVYSYDFADSDDL